MNRSFQILNFFGVAVLAVVCVLQWQTNRQVNLQKIDLEKIRLRQISDLEEKSNLLQNCSADLDSFRTQLQRSREVSETTEQKLTEAEQQARQLKADCAQLKESVSNWSSAVSARDERIKQDQTQFQELAEQRNAAVTKFNELAGKFNNAVTNLDERTRLYNEIVGKYNALVEKQADSSKNASSK